MALGMRRWWRPLRILHRDISRAASHCKLPALSEASSCMLASLACIRINLPCPESSDSESTAAPSAGQCSDESCWREHLGRAVRGDEERAELAAHTELQLTARGAHSCACPTRGAWRGALTGRASNLAK